MKRLLYLCTMVTAAALSMAAAVQTDTPVGLNSRAAELEQLNTALRVAKDAGQPADPAMLTRARELEAALHPELTVTPAASATPAPNGSQRASLKIVNPSGASLQPATAPESPLEQQIRELEAQLNVSMASSSAQMEDLRAPADLKDQLNELYAQRPENQPRRGNPLDQGTDQCPGTFIAALPFTDTGTTAGYANDYSAPTPCTPVSNAPDVVYYLVAAYTGVYTVSLCGSSYDTYLYVVEGACTLSQVACNDDYCGLQSQVSFNATAGLTYTIFVDGYSSAAGAYVINVSDDCSVPCQGGDYIECAEYPGPGFEGVDCDGGCNNQYWGGGTPTFEYISSSQTVCGVGFTYTDQGVNYRDTDWYEFIVTQQCTLRVTGTAEFPVQMGFLNAGCPNSGFLAVASGAPCSPLVVSTPGIVYPGNYVLHISVANQGVVPTARHYRASLQCIPINCLTCQPGDIQECAESQDVSQIANDCSGGSCNTYYGGVASYLPIQSGQTYCSRMFTYPDGMHWDTDWYTFTLTQSDSVAVTVQSGNFVPFVTGFSQTGDCSFMENYVFGSVCSSVTLSSFGCLPAGTYYVMVQAGDFSFYDPRPYRLSLNCTPCCNDLVLNAPGSASGTTCGAGNDCSHRASEDRIVQVNIPYLSQWTFSLCGSAEIWDSFIELTDACCGAVIEYNDDACGSFGLSRINCYGLPAGTYYVTIEGYLPSDCGPFTLEVAECSGRCCYGDPANPSCTVTNPISCSQLGGQYFEGETCASGCFVRPDCFASSVLSQPPNLPGELWNAYGADVNGAYREADNFDGLTAPIGSIRFWGISADASLVPCTEDPMQFEVRFYTTAGGLPGTLVNTYSGNLSGIPTYLYNGINPNYQGREYQMGLTPPCTLTSGWVEVIATDPSTPDCNFLWMESPFGDNLSAYRVNNGNWTSYTHDFACCLGAPCQDPDSVVIKAMSPTVNRLFFKTLVVGMYSLRWSSIPDGATPSLVKGQAYLYPGWWAVDVSTGPYPYSVYAFTVDCTVDTAPPVLDTPPGEEPLIFTPVASPPEAGR